MVVEDGYCGEGPTAWLANYTSALAELSGPGEEVIMMIMMMIMIIMIMMMIGGGVEQTWGRHR